MKKLIKGGSVVNEGVILRADLLIENDTIVDIIAPPYNSIQDNMEIIDATGMFVIPGVIDDQVHFREPGLTHKGDIAEGSRAAAAGGITSFMDMPNVAPPTTTNELLQQKQEIAAENSVINYSFYLGASTDNLKEIRNIDPSTTCGVKIFMGSSTGNLLVDQAEYLEPIFAESPILIATHCEDNSIIQKNLQHFQTIYGDDIPPEYHPLIRSRECCYASSAFAVSLARKYPHCHLHILHLSTKEEIDLLDKGERNSKKITGEVCVHHLWFNDQAYRTKGNLVKWNPAIKEENDRKALIEAINRGALDIIATDHAPHLIKEKMGIYTKSASGGPMVQHSLPVMLQLMDMGETTIENIVDKMCHAPATIFQIKNRGFLRPGYKADIALIKREPWCVAKDNIRYKCGWSPLEGATLNYQIAKTIVNGKIVFENGMITQEHAGEILKFDR